MLLMCNILSCLLYCLFDYGNVTFVIHAKNTSALESGDGGTL